MQNSPMRDCTILSHDLLSYNLEELLLNGGRWTSKLTFVETVKGLREKPF